MLEKLLLKAAITDVLYVRKHYSYINLHNFTNIFVVVTK